MQNRALFTGDNGDVMRGIHSDSVDLIYLDPPLNSNRTYEAPIGSDAAGEAFEDTWPLSDVDSAWDRIVPMRRSVPIVAAVVWLAAVGGGLEASPFAGLDQAAGVYVTVDGHGITIRQSAWNWDFYLPDGSKAEWKKGRGYGLPPHVKITCRTEGGYRPAARPKAVWTIPRPEGMPKGLGRKQRALWNRLWPWTWGDSLWHDGTEDAVDLGLSAVVKGEGVLLSKGTEGNRFTVQMWFQMDPETAAAARRLAKHCAAT